MHCGHIAFWILLIFAHGRSALTSTCSIRKDNFLLLPGRSCGISEPFKQIHEAPDQVPSNSTLECALIVSEDKEKWTEYWKEQAKPSK